jgi:uncharacterized protein (DUF1778 family)
MTDDKWRMFDRTLAEVRFEFCDLAPEALQNLIAEAMDAPPQPIPRLEKLLREPSVLEKAATL